MTELTRREREKAQHRKLMLEAAEVVFAQKGFHSATVHEVAELAEFSVGYMYNLFESKKDLFFELVDMRAAQYIAGVEERLARQEDPVEKVRTAIAAKLDFFTAHKQFFVIFSHMAAEDRAEGPVGLSEKCRLRYRDYMAHLADIFAEGVRQGVFIDVDPAAVVACMEGMTNAVIGQWVHSGGEEIEVATPEVIQRILLEGILAGGNGR